VGRRARQFHGIDRRPSDAGDPSPAGLSLVAGVALAKAVEALAPGVDAKLKWPNDLLIEGVKCTGILMERAGNSIVIGIGVNLDSAPELPDRPTVCFADKGRCDRPRPFAEVLAHRDDRRAVDVAARRHRPDHGGLDREGAPDREHRLRVSEQGIDGTFDGLAPDGALRLRRDGGEVMLIHAGDVELQRPVGEGS
jgi:BirA family biotin operon repressor/biotin-[acetyl-CoA-carboxylase] ligase